MTKIQCFKVEHQLLFHLYSEDTTWWRLYLCVVHCVVPSRDFPNLWENTTALIGQKTERDDGYLQTASSGKAQLLLKNTERKKYSYLHVHFPDSIINKNTSHFVYDSWCSTGVVMRSQYSCLTNRGHCDITRTSSFNIRAPFGALLRCLKSYKNNTCSILWTLWYSGFATNSNF